MAAAKPKRLAITCPRCGHRQSEPPAVVSTVCGRCQAHIDVRDGDVPGPFPSSPDPNAGRQVTCFRCGTGLAVVAAAESTMCKRCSEYIDLRDYVINQAASKNFRTHGRFVVETKGYVFNAECQVAEAVIKGRFFGKLSAGRLEVHSTARIEGSLQTTLLVVPVQQVFRWPKPLLIGGAEIAGELTATVFADRTVVIRSTARFFGDLTAKCVVVEPGAVVVGLLRVGELPGSQHGGAH